MDNRKRPRRAMKQLKKNLRICAITGLIAGAFYGGCRPKTYEGTILSRETTAPHFGSRIEYLALNIGEEKPLFIEYSFNFPSQKIKQDYFREQFHQGDKIKTTKFLGSYSWPQKLEERR